MEGGSFGLQIGGGEMDVVMMVMNESGANKLMKSEFTIGGEGAAMAGPVGRSATAETDAYMRAEILSYSRSRGLFAGLVLKGATLRADDDDNTELYGRTLKHEDILQGRVPAPAIAAVDHTPAHAPTPASAQLAIRLRGQRMLNPPRLVDALAESVRTRGAAVHEGTAVTQIARRNGKYPAVSP